MNNSTNIKQNTYNNSNFKDNINNKTSYNIPAEFLSIKNNNINYNNSSTEVSILVTIKSDKHDDWVKELNILIVNNVNTNYNSSNSATLTITDSEDPLFLYQASITESDFHSIKQSQSLLIDFSQFSNKLIEMIDMCKDTSINNNSNLNNISIIKGLSQFNCILEEKQSLGEAVFIIQETTQLAYISHLKLCFKKPTDTNIKKHLSNLCIDFKHKYEETLQDNKSYKDKNQELNNKVYELNDIIKEEINNKKKELDLIEFNKNKEIIDKENKLIKENQNINNQFNNKIKLIEDDYKEKINNLNNELKLLNTKNSELNNNLNNINHTYKELLYSNERTLNDYNNNKLILEELKNENKNLLTLKYKNDKLVSELEVKLESAIEKFKEKDTNNNSYINLIDSLKQTCVSITFYCVYNLFI